MVKESKFGTLFETLVPDPNSKEGAQIKVIKDEDIIACITLGGSIGLPPMVAITFGKTLDKLAYFKVMKGKSLGMDIVSSLHHVFAYEKDGNIITGMDSHAINATIINNGITYHFVDDFKQKLYYRDSKTKEFLGYNKEDNYFVINKGCSANDLTTAINAKKTLVTEHITFYSKVEFDRKGWKTHIEEYSLLDATEAGLYKGIDFVGNEVKGKVAWNAHPKTILNGRVIAIGARKIGGDVLNGLYTKEELDEITNDNSNEPITPHQEV
jgi:hypothetical protein